MRLHAPASPLLAAVLTATAFAQEGGSSFGHARTRELAELGKLPSPRDVVVRDIVNYHRHRLPLPKAGDAVALEVRLHQGWPCDDVWLQVGYTTTSGGDRALAEPCAVALVVDVSGSMQDAGKMSAVKAGLRAFAERLRPDDDVAVITFSTTAQVVAARRARGDGRWLLDAVEHLEPGGNTNLHAGLMLGLAELARGEAGARQRRVVLLTDGIANTGVTDPARIVADATHGDGTIDISTIGVGQDLDTALLQRLADGTRGLFHFVADATDVQKVFVQEAEALLTPVARRPWLVLDLPRELRVVQVFDPRARVQGQHIDLDLPDLNAGVTGVVVVRCQSVDGATAERNAAVRAELSFRSATTRRTETVQAQASFAPDRRGDDLEVRKNAAIAVLAQGLADLATACEARRWADAEGSLQRATDEALRLFPGDDNDVKRVREMAAAHAKTLRRYVDRFRDS